MQTMKGRLGAKRRNDGDQPELGRWGRWGAADGAKRFGVVGAIGDRAVAALTARGYKGDAAPFDATPHPAGFAGHLPSQGGKGRALLAPLTSALSAKKPRRAKKHGKS